MRIRNLGTWILAAVLLLFLAWAMVAADLGWTSIGGDVGMPPIGYAALAFGVVISLIAGVGLMALVFYSSRAGYDEPPKYHLPDKPTKPAQDSSEDSAQP